MLSFSAWFCPCVYVQMVWPSTYFFARHQHDTLSPLPPETRDVAARDSIEGQVSTKYGTRYRVRVNFAINLSSHLCAGVILICYTVLRSPKKGETAVHGCNPTLSVSVVLVSRK